MANHNISCNNYLFRQTNYIFYFRRGVPRNLQPILKRREIKLSLATRDKSNALIALARIAPKVEESFFVLKESDMPFPKDFDPSKVLGLVLTRSSKLADGTVDERKYELDSSHPKEELALLQAIEASLSSVPASPVTPETAVVTPPSAAPIPPITSLVSQSCQLEPLLFSELVEKFMLFRTGVRDATKEMERSIFNIF